MSAPLGKLSDGRRAVISMAMDITEHKKAEENIYNYQKLLQRIINLLPVRIFWKDKNLKFLGCNEVFAKDAGKNRPEELIGKDDFQMVWKEQAKIYQDDDQSVIKSGKPKLNFEEPQTTPKGNKIWLKTSKVPLTDLQGNTIGILGTYEDITELKKAQEEINQAYKNLKDTQVQLIQSNKMSALGQLASGVAHELNNPLTGVLNNVQLIKMEAELKKDFNLNDFKELLDVVEESALRCKKIAQSLLDFTHIGTGAFTSVSINDIARKAIDLVNQELKLRNIIFKEELQPDLPKIQGNLQLLQQVFYGIFVNAKWAIEKKTTEGGTITVKTTQNPQTRMIDVSISDTGIGIPQDNIPKLFTPFFTTKDVGEGTGLGLAIFYNIIKSHNGDIRLESQVNIGTTFIINLPY
jgi:PAS domain S-box-containing protein